MRGAFINDDDYSYYLTSHDYWYGGISFSKARANYTYTRSFYKIDELLSYIGGLIALALSVLTFFLPYTELCYELPLCKQIFQTKDGEPLDISFNFLSYLLYGAYSILTYFCSCFQVQEYELYKKCS